MIQRYLKKKKNNICFMQLVVLGVLLIVAVQGEMNDMKECLKV